MSTGARQRKNRINHTDADSLQPLERQFPFGQRVKLLKKYGDILHCGWTSESSRGPHRSATAFQTHCDRSTVAVSSSTLVRLIELE